MDRRTTAWIATAAASAALVAGTGAVLALQSDPKPQTVQLNTVDTSSVTSLDTTTVTDAPTTTVVVTVTTSTSVAPSTTAQYVAPSTTLYVAPVAGDSGVCLNCVAPTTVITIPLLPPLSNP